MPQMIGGSANVGTGRGLDEVGRIVAHFGLQQSLDGRPDAVHDGA